MVGIKDDGRKTGPRDRGRHERKEHFNVERHGRDARAARHH